MFSLLQGASAVNVCMVKAGEEERKTENRKCRKKMERNSRSVITERFVLAVPHEFSCKGERKTSNKKQKVKEKRKLK